MTAATRPVAGRITQPKPVKPVLQQTRRERDRARAALTRLDQALDEAERGFATVMRIEHLRAIVRTR